MAARRRDGGRARRRGWAVTGALGVLFIVIGALGALLYRDAVAVAGHMQAAREALDDAIVELSAGDVEEALLAMSRTRNDLTSSQVRTNRLLWRIAERVPFAGATFRTTRAAVEVADAGAALGAVAVGGAKDLLDDEGRVIVRATDGQIDLDPLLSVKDAVGALDSSELEAALRRLEAGPEGNMPASLVEARRDLLEFGRRAVETTTGLQNLVGAVVPLSGADGPRTYLLAMQNPAESRGTGGLIGFFAELQVDRGRFLMTRPEAYEALSPEWQDGPGASGEARSGEPEPPTEDPLDGEPVAVGVDFDRRYGAANAAGYVANVNLDPDLPTVAPVLLDLYERRRGRALDGVVLVDPVALAAMLETVGPVTLPPDVTSTAPTLPNPVSSEQVVHLTTVEVYRAFEGRTAARKDYLRNFADAAFTHVLSSSWDGFGMARALGQAATSGHLAVWSAHEEQAELLELDVAGALAPPEGGRDWIGVASNNIAGNKLDAHTRRVIRGTVALHADAADRFVREARLAVDVEVPKDVIDEPGYISGSYPLSRDGAPSPRTDSVGLSRTWLSFWVGTPAVIHPLPEDDAQFTKWAWSMGARSGRDAVIEALPGYPANIEVEGVDVLSLPKEVDGNLRYVLEIRQAARLVPDRIDLEVLVPAGRRVASTTASDDLETRVGDDLRRVRVTGETTNDIVIEVIVTKGDG